MWSRVVFFILFATAVTSFRLQSPVVEVCPHALRVSIPDSPGIQLFAFHGNINDPIGETEAGQMSRDVIHKASGRWIFETQTETFKIGDTLNYWIYVIHRGLGYRSDVMEYTIDAFSNKCEIYNSDSSEEEVRTESQKFGRRRNKEENTSHFQHHFHHHRGYGHYGWRPPTNYPTVTPFPQTPTFPTGSFQECQCDKDVQKLTESLSETRLKLDEALNATEVLKQDFQGLNEVLGNILDRLKFGRKLLLTGVFSSDDNPYGLIKTILEDKLDLSDLKLRVLSATTTVHGAIIFEMTSASDKLRVLLRAKRLDKLKLRIIDYQEEENELAGLVQVTQSPISSSAPTQPTTDGPNPDIDVRFGKN
ncbi:uncharacterized protein LOC132262193 [Phlebotomus argentipes]|uniref:uncharacterized protein LOC132262193 n=1 Tax=Phlebotomus argentipes TaxID=94469 RepID=UPI0028935F75|nr:uncharacterized protein LOC132262193 [Phlebotomus argentipes]XP_059617356.1 uncharacterized protein LOC132262193 [Phlebotomus argentipes]XP_059617357.1 uncharacterized protein LOC132262193 [Phlebotomus argentipes]